MTVKVWYEEKRRITQYETLTVGLEMTLDHANTEISAKAGLEALKHFVAEEMPKALEEARKR